MGEHKTNPVALANSNPRQTVQALDLGEGIALLGMQLIPVLDEKKEKLVVLLVAVGGRKSDFMPMQPRPVAICELAKADLVNLRKILGGGEEAPILSTTPASPPDACAIEMRTSGLVVCP